MSGTKRRRSRSPSTSRKVSRLADEDEDLEEILEKIRQQEESEALAQKLQREFETSHAQAEEVVDLPGEYVSVDSTDEQGNDAIPHNAVGSSLPEDDETMARRLAREWAELDTGKMSTERAEATRIVKIKPPSGIESLSSSQSAKGDGETTGARLVSPEVPMVKPHDELSAYRDMFIWSRKCTKCGKDVASPRNFVVFSTTIPPPTLLALLHSVCEDCGQSHCRGCFRALACPRNCKGKRCTVAKCCAEVRAVALFEALGGFDLQYIGENVNSSDDKKKSSKSSRKVAKGTGYATGSTNKHTNSSRDGKDKHQMAVEASKVVAARWDDVVLRALDTITWLLPSPYSDAAAPYDLLPHQSIRALISMSYLPELLGGLLINDSVTDWTERGDVYNSMLKLLRRMVDSELTVSALIDERWEKKQSAGLQDWMWGDGSIEWETHPKTTDIVRAPPLFDHFKKLTKQCETFLAGASHLLEDGSDDELQETTVRATSLCGDMISAQQEMQRALSIMMRGSNVAQIGSTGKGKGRDSNIDMEKRYCTACEELAFKHVAMSNNSTTRGLSYPNYLYAREVEETSNSTRLPAKRLHLVGELSMISTSLPPGIWIRVDEVRNDVIKIMIAGPDDTPYAGGLFEFHCFLPLEYPDISPSVNLCTTASGRVRFNPNLYADGKVCLSLLGTWPGRPEEQWSSKSTLLQVLISIQSMILVDAPYFNEPGFGAANLKDPRSIHYNKNIALQTVRWAMVEWMQEEHRSGIWADVIANHFSIRHEKILGCIRKWAKEDARFGSYSSSTTRLAGSDMVETSYPYRPAGRDQTAGDLQNQDLQAEFERGCKLVQDWLIHQRLG